MLIKPDENPRRPIASFSDDPGFERYTRRSAPGLVQGPGRAAEEDHPPARGATVFENSTACALFDRTLGREVCPGSTPSLGRSPRGASRTAVPELTPSCAPEPSVYLGSGLPASPVGFKRFPAFVPADRERKGLILPGTDPGLGVIAGRDTACGRSRLRIFLTTLCGSSSRRV